MGTANFYSIHDEVFVIKTGEWVERCTGTECGDVCYGDDICTCFRDDEKQTEIVYDDYEIVDYILNDIIQTLELCNLVCVRAPAHRAVAPRSFRTGTVVDVYNHNCYNDHVARLELCNGYYDGANINVYAANDLEQECGKSTTSFNKRDIKHVFDTVRQFTESYVVTERFSNGEAWYEKKAVV